MSRAPLKTTITDGQPYVDEPVYAVISKATDLALIINVAFSPRIRTLGLGEMRRMVSQGRCEEMLRKLRNMAQSPAPVIAPEIRALSHYNRVRLRWMRPDGNGGLVPR